MIRWESQMRRCGYALKVTQCKTVWDISAVQNGWRGCQGCGKIHKTEFEEFIFNAMRKRFKNFQVRHDREEKVNPKLTAHQIELAQVEAEIEKLLDTLTEENAHCLPIPIKKLKN